MRRLAIVAAAASVVVWGVCWVRFATRLASNPQPGRYVEYRNLDGTKYPIAFPASPPFCHGPALIDGDVVWQVCEDAVMEARTRFVRADLARGVATISPPIDGTMPYLIGAARAPDGTITAIVQGGAVYRLGGDGSVTTLGELRGDEYRVAGVRWIGDALEIVAAGVQPGIDVLDARGWHRRAIAAPPDVDRAFPRLVAAERDGDAWTLWWMRAGLDERGPITILRGGEHGGAAAVATLAASDLALDAAVDDAASGAFVDALAFPDRTFAHDHDAWAPLGDSHDARDTLEFDYVFDGDLLRSVPRAELSQRVRPRDRWLVADDLEAGLRLREVDGRTGPIVAREPRLDADQLHVLPASDGGLWLVGFFGAYLHVSAELANDRPLGALGRVAAFDDSFERWEGFDDRYVEHAGRKRWSFPICLLLLPALALVAAPAWLAVRRHRARIALAAAALYLAPALWCIGAFWYATRFV